MFSRLKTILIFIVLLFASATMMAQDKPVHIFLLRHAEKATDGTQDPPLSAAGAAYAEQLNGLLSGVKIGAVFSTPYKRTMMTAAPVARANGLEIKNYNPFDVKGLLRQIEAARSEHVLVIGHANTVPMLINELFPSADMKDLKEEDQGLLFIISYEKDRPASRSYFVLHTGMQAR